MPTLVDNEEPNLTAEDCKEYLGGKVAFFWERINTGQRIGQAWFNALDPWDQDKLRGSFYDPFHADNWPAVIKALRFLLDN